MEEGIYICEDCKERIPIAKGTTDSLLIHILKHNHMVFETCTKETNKKSRISCCYCGNVNCLIMGYSDKTKSHVCLGCIGNKWVFSSELEWRDVVSSWHPLALSNAILDHLDSIPQTAGGKCSTVSEYAAGLNHFYLSRLASYQKERRTLSINGSFSAFDESRDGGCLRARVNGKDMLHFRAGMCCSMKAKSNGTRNMGCIVLLVEKDTILVHVTSKQTLPPKGECSLVIRTSVWEDLLYPVNAGRLRSGKNLSSTLMDNFLGKPGINGHYNNCSINDFKRVRLSGNERTELDFCARHELSIIECGSNPLKLAELAGITALSVQEGRKRQVAFVSTNDKLLDLVATIVNNMARDIKSDNTSLFCARVCNDDYVKSHANVQQYAIQTILPGSPSEDLYELNVARSKKLAEFPFLAVSSSETDCLQFMPTHVVVVLHAEYMSDVRMSGLLRGCDQLSLWCEKMMVQEEKPGVGDLGVARLVKMGMRVKSVVEGGEKKSGEKKVVENEKKENEEKPVEKVNQKEPAEKVNGKRNGRRKNGKRKNGNEKKPEGKTEEKKPVEEKAEEKPEQRAIEQKAEKKPVEEKKVEKEPVKKEEPAEEKRDEKVEKKPVEEKKVNEKKPAERKRDEKKAEKNVDEKKSIERVDEKKPAKELNAEKKERTTKAKNSNRPNTKNTEAKKTEVNETPKQEIVYREDGRVVAKASPKPKREQSGRRNRGKRQVKEEKKPEVKTETVESVKPEAKPVAEKKEMESKKEEKPKEKVVEKKEEIKEEEKVAEEKKPEEKEEIKEKVVEKTEEVKEEKPKEEKEEKPVEVKPEEVKLEEKAEEKREEKTIVVEKKEEVKEEKPKEEKKEEKRDEIKEKVSPVTEEKPVEVQKEEKKDEIKEEVKVEKEEEKPVAEEKPEEKPKEDIIEERAVKEEKPVEVTPVAEKSEEKPVAEDKTEEVKIEDTKEEVKEANEAKSEEPKPEEKEECEVIEEKPKEDEPSAIKPEELKPEAKPEELKPEIATPSEEPSNEEKQKDDEVLSEVLLSEVGFSEKPFEYASMLTTIEPLEVPNVPSEGLILPEKKQEEELDDPLLAKKETPPAPVEKPQEEVKEVKEVKPKSKHWLWWSLPKDDEYSNCYVGGLFLFSLCSTNTPFLRVAIQQPLRQQLHAVASAATRNPVHRSRPHSRSSNVQVRPRQVVLHELEQERSSRARAALTTHTHAAQIRHRRTLDFRLVLLLDRHSPATLLHLVTRRDQRLRHLVIVHEQARRVLAQSHTDSSRQRANVHQTLQLVLLLQVRHRVGEDQTTLRVRVAHLHKLALFITPQFYSHIVRLQNRARLVARIVDHVLHRRNRHHQVHRRVHSRQRLQRTQRRRRPAHVQVHVLDEVRWLQVQTARVEAHALAHHAGELRLRVVASTGERASLALHVGHDDEAWRAGGALSNSFDHIQLLAVEVGRLGVSGCGRAYLENADFDVVLVADLAAEEFQGSRVHLAGLLICPHARVHGSYA